MTSPKVSINIPLPSNTRSRVVFSDVNYSTYSINNDEVIYNVKAIGLSLMTILSTYQEQRLFHPTFGANLEMYLFEPVDEINAYNIRNEIVNALRNWENRVRVSENTVTVTPILDEERYYVEIKYAVPDLEDEGTLTFNLDRGTK